MVKPLSPAEALEHKAFSIPDQIIDAVNQLLVEKIKPNGGKIYIRQRDITALALKNFKDSDIPMSEDMIFKQGWMDFEPTFEKVGWKVSYDRPGYNEDYEAIFEFSKRSST